MDFNLRFYSALKSKFKQFPMKMSSETKVGMSHFDKVELKHFDFPYYFNGKKKKMSNNARGFSISGQFS